MTPEALNAWIPVIRDILIVGVATFMLLFEVIVKAEPNPYVIGGGLTLLGVPPALRIDRKRRNGNGNGDDPYDGPGGYFKG